MTYYANEITTIKKPDSSWHCFTVCNVKDKKFYEIDLLKPHPNDRLVVLSSIKEIENVGDGLLLVKTKNTYDNLYENS